MKIDMTKKKKKKNVKMKLTKYISNPFFFLSIIIKTLTVQYNTREEEDENTINEWDKIRLNKKENASFGYIGHWCVCVRVCCAVIISLFIDNDIKCESNCFYISNECILFSFLCIFEN